MAKKWRASKNIEKKEFSNNPKIAIPMNMKSLLFVLLLMSFLNISLHSKGILYVQSAKAKLLTAPQLSADGTVLKVGDSLSPLSEQGLFVQVRNENKTGWVSKLFVSPLPPSSQIKLGVTSNSTESVAARQRASDFVKTAAARGLSETEKLRVRGGAESYDFESLRWLESLPITPIESGLTQSKQTPVSVVELPSVSEDTKLEVKMGRALAARLIQKYGLIKNEEFTIYLNQVGERIAAVSSRTDLSFKIGILNSDEVNAFACPGGFIFLTKGALHKMQSESELAGVIGHEIGHIVLFHNGSFQKTNLFIDILAGMLSPSGGEVINVAASAALDELEKKMFETGRDASVEWEADEAGVGLAGQSGYAPKGLGNYLARLMKAEHTDTLKKTHPDTASRLAKLSKFETSSVDKSTPLNKDKWSRYKEYLP